MNYEIHIENLGAIKEADFIITPLTIIAGENGTGKSFVTKFLYSILNAVNIDIYSNHTVTTISRLGSILNRIVRTFHDIEQYEEVESELTHISEFNEVLSDIPELIAQIESDYYELDGNLIKDLEYNMKVYTETVYPNLNAFLENSYKEDFDTTSENFPNSSIHFLRRLRGPKILLDRASTLVNELSNLLVNPQTSYLRVLSEYITNELKENFQISEIQNLINYEEVNSVFILENIIEVYINKDDGLSIKLQSEYLSEFEKINHIIFFESPVYWRLLPVINELDKTGGRGLSHNSKYEVLTGIPKYFYDLKKLLFTNFKEGERPSFIIECANSLQSHLKGYFKPSDNDLTFENSAGHNIPKNLVSFGMTNIGIIQAVLNKNIINKGSFIFIDEPESNLHPEWQNILAHTLAKLAKNNVYIIVTSHSTDMLKAIDISTQEMEVQSSLTTYYLENNGHLLGMSNENLTQTEQARQKLLEPYDELTIRGYALD
ncbi:AAA family ATPase [uncultured Psychrobacter sp.]|uniref:AAA family ATPase n=1 Tax=uncultured Psychrobacter sp. TaxID=259303 RepID=UPI002626B4A9|nr:AAA family ATPase [uncultured Psychrobacter sp.]